MNIATWIELRNLVACEFSQKYAAFSSKGLYGKQKQSGVMALFLLKERMDAAQSEDVAMMGHRIGVSDDTKQFCEYLSDLREILRPEGQMFLIAIRDVCAPQRQSPLLGGGNNTEYSLLNKEAKYRNGVMLGPYFGLFHLSMAALQNIASKTNWQCRVLFDHEDGGYAVEFHV